MEVLQGELSCLSPAPGSTPPPRQMGCGGGRGKASFELGARSDQVVGSLSIFPVGAVALDVVGPLPQLSGAEMGTGWELDGNRRNTVLKFLIMQRNRVVKQS